VSIVPGSLEFPNLRIVLAEQSADSWYQWHEDFVVEGHNGEDKEKNGLLTLLSSNLQSELATVRFFNLGIFRLSQVKSEANSDQISRVAADLYCERMDFIYQAV
jgi:hypothetical protein